jgi:hypothetical protein
LPRQRRPYAPYFEKIWSPTEGKIWKHTRDKALLPKHRQFIWKSLHNAFKVGRWWSHAPSQEDKAECHCGIWTQEESMQHILTECAYPGQREIWELAKQLWEKKGERWPHISRGLILGAGQVRFEAENTTEEESAYLIWLLRVERVIQRGNNRVSTTQEIRKRWIAAVNARLTLDREMTKGERSHHTL